MKPDVVAVGLNSDVMGTDGNLRRANGTSFASPIMCGMVACLWQACPKLTAKQIIDLVRQSGDRADFPDNIYGYGIPDLWKAYQSVSYTHLDVYKRQSSSRTRVTFNFKSVSFSPNSPK